MMTASQRVASLTKKAAAPAEPLFTPCNVRRPIRLASAAPSPPGSIEIAPSNEEKEKIKMDSPIDCLKPSPDKMR